RMDTDTGKTVMLTSGEQLSHESAPTTPGGAPGWQPLRRLSRSELDTRRARSILLNGFDAPMETMPVIEKELGFIRSSRRCSCGGGPGLRRSWLPCWRRPGWSRGMPCCAAWPSGCGDRASRPRSW
ncbi:MAG: hypothetical protein ACKOBY_11535, partial [Cyanobium sp.]